MSISKKIRFEIFKRDSFKCQYCGKSSPDVILEVDHIIPKKENGKDDIENLITACFECNRGKNKIRLDNKDELKKQKIELDKLNEKREQLKLMMKWREELKNINDEQVEIVENEFSELTNNMCSWNENGIKQIKSYLKKYGLEIVLESQEICVNQYLKLQNDTYTQESQIIFTKMMPRVCCNLKLQSKYPYLKDLYHCRSILKNRLSYINLWRSFNGLKFLYNHGIEIQDIKDICCNIKTWTEFTEKVLQVTGEKI